MNIFNINDIKKSGALNTSKFSLLFIMVGILLTGGYLLLNSYNDVKRVHESTIAAINDRQSKHSSLTTMLYSARERSLLLLRMVSEEDIFELDDLNQQFHEQARIFITARENLFQLGLTKKDILLLNKLLAHVKINSPKQNKVAELFLEGKRQQATQLLFGEAVSGQKFILEQFGYIFEEYNKNSIEFFENMDKDLEANTKTYILMGTLLLIIGVFAIFIMMTRISRKEEQKLSHVLNKLEEQKFALDQHAIVAITDIKGVITYANDKLCQVSGYTRGELINHHHHLLIPDEKDKNYDSEMYHTVTSGKVWSGEICNRAKDGHAYWLDSTTIPFIRKDGTPRSFITIQTDITKRKQSEAALRRSQKMDALGQLTGGIAHDFNNILNIIMGNLEMLKRLIPDNTDALKRIDNAHKSTKRAAELTRQLLSFSRHQAENVSLTNINQLIEEMENLIAYSITPQVEIKWQLEKELWSTKISPGDFEDALLNLVINSRDAMSGSGQLSVETSNITLDNNYCLNNPDARPGDYVLLTIIDCGEGIPAEQLEHIFEPFFTTKDQGKGTGLGLAMVFGFIQRSEGHIKVESKPGSGTTFLLYLPRSIETTQAIDLTIEPPGKTLPEGKETILVVDDEEGLRELGEELLLDLGYKVLTAANGQQALEVLAKEPDIDLMISDVIMPGGINGYELAEQATSKYPKLKVLMASGYTEKVARSKQHERFESNLLAKPYTQSELAQKVRDNFNK